MKYYARINKETVGPLTLGQLVAGGVRPSTYVWCKGMVDWAHASDVPDVCRAMRRTLAGLDPETGEERDAVNPNAAQPDAPGMVPIANPQTRSEVSQMIRQAWEESEKASRPDFNTPPPGVSIPMAVAVTVLCFPITGFAAIYYAAQCKRQWSKSLEAGLGKETVDRLRRGSWESARMYRMMLGISVSLGFLMAGFVYSRTLQG